MARMRSAVMPLRLARTVSGNAPPTMLKRFPAKPMGCFKIGKKIQNVKYDELGMIEPV